MKTTDLIAQLSQQPGKPSLRPPAYYASRVALVLGGYAVATQLFLGIRSDLLMQLSRPLFTLELVLLFMLTIASGWGAVLSMYPDAYQRRMPLRLPYIIFAALLVLILLQLRMPEDARMQMPGVGAHGMECALCIASVALFPSVILFGLMRRGASLSPLKAGSFAVFAATGIGCFTLRFAEANDSLIHLAQWHYFPTLIFAALGTLVGHYLLRW